MSRLPLGVVPSSYQSKFASAALLDNSRCLSDVATLVLSPRTIQAFPEKSGERLYREPTRCLSYSLSSMYSIQTFSPDPSFFRSASFLTL